ALVLVAVAVAGAEQLAQCELEVLDLVAIPIPVRRAHGVEEAPAVGGIDVGRNEARIVAADVAGEGGAALRVGGTSLARLVAAGAGSEARPAPRGPGGAGGP